LAQRLDPSPLPRAPTPMLATLVAEPFDNRDWIFEPKFDGLRVLGVFDGRELTLLSRNGRPQNFQFPEIAEALRRALRQPAVVDGEVVSFDAKGRTSFRELQQRFHLQDAGEVEARRREHPASVYLFDVLYAGRFDVTHLPLEERKRILKQIVKWSQTVRWTDFTSAKGKLLLHRACRDGEEGIIGKHRQSRYVAGRSDRWVKFKCVGRQEFVIGGFTDPQRSRIGLGALLVGYYDDGNRLLYAGKVGTGYSDNMLRNLRAQLDRLEQDGPPFDPAGPEPWRPAHWVKPKLVAEVAFGEWTQNHLLSQPRFEGLRPDKKPGDCRREKPKALPVAARRSRSFHMLGG
jgi:bifunctional non-homologous end joining protein LigD